MKELNFNRESSKKYGWTPEWFGYDSFDEGLIEAIKDFQKNFNIVADGLVGPSTHRRIETFHLENEEQRTEIKIKEGEKFIIYNNKKFPIAWERVVLWNEEGGLSHKKGSYYDWIGKPDRRPIQFVNHWDAALSSHSCARIINKRGLSMHFLIDNDGTIYQTLDIQNVAFQAGSKFWNTNSVGVEISNAFYLKYQDWYVKQGFGKRPVVESFCHGRSIGKHLDFYPIQLQALAALWAAIHESTGINLDCWEEKSYSEEVAFGRFNGFINHCNLTKNKIDCASLNMGEVLENAKSFSQNC